jgi:DNA-binding NtrC family response regulator
MRRLRLQVQRIGPHFRTVLVSGEAGTEKELVARALHRISRNARGPFVACSAATFERALVANHGRVKPDGADHWTAICQQGTLFLHEISEMPLKAQGRLLDTLQRLEPTQSHVEAPQRMDLQLIASTTDDLRVLVSTGCFRHELYQRLATVEITVPPLRQRIDDLDVLVRYFLGQFAVSDGGCSQNIAEDEMEQMRRYHWPENLRELESVLRDGVLRSNRGLLRWHHMPVLVRREESEQSAASANRSIRLQEIVEQHVMRVLKDCKGNKLRAAEMLGISRSTLYRMLDTGTFTK